MQDYWVDLPVCNNYADIGLPEVYNDPALASFNSAVMQESPTDETHYVKQAVGVFATDGAANAAFQDSSGNSVIDPTEVYYDGNSQGGIFGGITTAVSPDIHRAVLGVTGQDYANALVQRSTDFGAWTGLRNTKKLLEHRWNLSMKCERIEYRGNDPVHRCRISISPDVAFCNRTNANMTSVDPR